MKRQLPKEASKDEAAKQQPFKRARVQRDSPVDQNDLAAVVRPSLPPELWHHILGFLKNRSLFGTTSLVCSTWRSLSLRAVRSINFRNERWARNSTSEYEIVRRLAFIQANCPSVRVLRIACSNVLLPFLPRGLKELHFTGLQVHYAQKSLLSIVVNSLGFLPTSLRCLVLSPQLKLTDSALASLCERDFAFLEELTIMDASLITDQGLERLSASAALTSSLKCLRLYCAKSITNEAGHHIARFTNLIRLSLPCSPLSAAGTAPFASLRCLRKLNLAYSKAITDRALKSLPRALRSLNLTATKVTDRGLQYLSMAPRSPSCPSPPPLLSPSLSFSSALRFYHHISANTTTTAPHGGRTSPVQPRATTRSAFYSSSHMVQSTTPQLPYLTKLKLNECFITDEGIKFLLPYLRSLTTLKLSSTFITSASGQALSSFRSTMVLEVNNCCGGQAWPASTTHSSTPAVN